MNFTLKALFNKAALLLLLTGLSPNIKAAECLANFTYTVHTNGQVDFTSTALSIYPISSFNWIFSDGGYGTGNTISHTFYGTGWRQITHYIHCPTPDSTGCDASILDSIYVDNSACQATCSFDVVPDTLNSGYFSLYPAYPANMVSVLWNFGDGSSSNALYPSHTYTTGGAMYTICMTVYIACGDSAVYCAQHLYTPSSQGPPIVSVLNNPATAIKTNQKNGISRAHIYPNPASGQATLNIYSETTGTCTAGLYDMTGRLMLTENIKTEPGTTSTELNTGFLQSGLYFISLSNGTQHTTLRLIKE